MEWGKGGGGNFTSSPPQNEPLKIPPRLGLISCTKMFIILDLKYKN